LSPVHRLHGVLDLRADDLVQYWYGARDAGPANEFEPLFRRLIQDAFGGGMSEEDVVAALTELRECADS
jgi:hypothetical protein